MSSGKFRDKLEPLRLQREWARDAALRRAALMRRELESLREQQARLARAAVQQAQRAGGHWAASPNPEARAGALRWLAIQQHACAQAGQDVAAAKVRLSEAFLQCEHTSAKLDAVEQQTQRNRTAHAHVQNVTAQKAADDDWLVRKALSR